MTPEWHPREAPHVKGRGPAAAPAVLAQERLQVTAAPAGVSPPPHEGW